MRKFLCIILTLLLLFSTGCKPPASNLGEGEYSNPVWEPILADPAIIRHEGVYYAYGTEDNGIWSSTESGIRYIPILKSEDLITWEYAGQVFAAYTDKPVWGTLGANLWAPDVIKIGDTFVLYYSLSKWGDPNPGIGIAVADHPLGPWTDRGELLRSDTIGVNNSIDPTVFKGSDNKIYMIWGSFKGLYGVQLTDDGLAFASGEQEAANAAKTFIGAGGPINETYEGAYVIIKDGMYYLFVSLGTCCNGHNSTYNVKVVRSQNPLGPYTDHLGRNLTSRNVGSPVVMGSGRFAGVGHNSVVMDDAGNYFIAYHGFDRHKPETINGVNRRSLLIDKLLWDEDGWPYVEGYIPSENAPNPTINK